MCYMYNKNSVPPLFIEKAIMHILHYTHWLTVLYQCLASIYYPSIHTFLDSK